MRSGRARLLNWRRLILGAGQMSAEQQLRQEIAVLKHELRRVSDALERGPSHALQQRAQQLRDNIALCERELKQHSASAGARASDE